MLFKCATSSTTVIVPSVLTSNVEYSLWQYKALNAPTASEEAEYAYLFPDFTCSNMACCNTLTYEVKAGCSSTGATSTCTGTVPTAVSATPAAVTGSAVVGATNSVVTGTVLIGSATAASTMYFKQANRSYLDDITAPANGAGYYWLYVSNNGATSNGISFTSRSHVYSERIHWKMICGPTSTTVTEGTYPGSYSNW